MKKLAFFAFLLLLLNLRINAQSGCPSINLGNDIVMNCSDVYVTLRASVVATALTSTTYDVNSIPFDPPYSFSTGTPILVNQDDVWSGVINLPFDFCFFGNTYNKIIAGANGVVSFNVASANGACAWQFNSSIPNTSLFRNAIFGPYHDMDPRYGGNMYMAILGQYPCRTFVVNWNNIPLYQSSCHHLLATSQIVLYENTNAIDVYIDKRPVCTSWNNGNGVIGIQNSTGTQGYTPPGRNTGRWTTTQEAWRFTPHGTPQYNVKWYNASGTYLGTGDSIRVAPASATSYYAVMEYTTCNGAVLTLRDDINVTFAPQPLTLSTTSDTLCPGNSAVLTATGADSYLWSTGETTSSITVSPTTNTTYTVTGTSLHCTDSRSIPIKVSTAMQIQNVITDVSCYGGNNGSNFPTVTSANGSVTYTWSSGSNQNLSAGNYSVTATDSHGCSVTSNFTIQQPAALGVTLPPAMDTCTAGVGKIIPTVTGGTIPYAYLWSNGATSGSISGLSAGNYALTVTDAHGCTANAGTQVTATSVPVITMDSVVNDYCGTSSGGIFTTITSGTAPYSYIWNTGNTTSENLTNLPGGSYSLTVTDTYGCNASAGYTIQASPTPLSVALSSIMDTCSVSSGAVTSTVLGGGAPYTYLWSNGATSENISGLSAGNYTLTVTDARGCTVVAGNTVAGSSKPVITTDSVVDDYCGNSNGSIFNTITSGTVPYRYSWSTGNTASEDLTNLSAGTYSFTVTDAYGCTASSNHTIQTPSVLLSLNLSSTMDTCSAGTGSITSTVTGGTMPYTYLWSSGATSANLTALSGGNYSLTVTDAHGCIVTANTTITSTSLPVITTDSVTDDYCGNGNGSIYTTVTSGTLPYRYSWNTGNTASEDLTSLLAGNYSLTITDSYGCTASSNYTIQTPSPLSLTLSSIMDTCSVTMGAVNSTVSGGTIPYTYLWSNGSTSGNIANLSSGTYALTVTDVHGCVSTANTTITSTPVPVITNNSITDDYCGNANGSILNTVTSGTLPYSYLWSSGSTASEDLANLSSGTYSLTVTDAYGCATSSTYTIQTPPSLSLTLSSTMDTCSVGVGAITATISGGTTPYTYLWSNGATSRNITSLSSGTYALTVTDAHGCTITDNAAITSSPAVVITTNSVLDDYCNEDDGSILTTVTSGTAPYSYLWNTGNTTSGNLTSLQAGSYSLTVTDVYGCTASSNYTIQALPSLTLTLSSITDSCSVSVGAVNSTVSGGTTPYTYLWSNGASSENITGLSSGTYSLTVTDTYGCMAISGASVMSTSLPVIATDSVKGDYCNDGNGSIFNTISSGTLPYRYSWSTGSTASEDLANLSAGTYTLTVTDAYGCVASSNYTVQSFPALSLTLSSIVDSCSVSVGSVNSIVSGGSIPYTYLWSNGSVSGNITGLSAGNYALTVTDVHGCIITANTVVTATTVPVITTGSVTDDYCGTGNGSILNTVSSGTTPYQYSWNTGNTTSGNLTNLSAGSYSLTVTDAYGCVAISNHTIQTPVALALTLSSKLDTCSASVGSISSTVSGGSIPYTYLWSNGATSGNISALSAGTYALTVTDAHGCVATANTTVTATSVPVITMNTVTDDYCRTNNGSISNTITSGTLPYTYLWNTGNTTSENLTNLPAGSYSLTVTDVYGCSATSNYTVQSPVALSLALSSTIDSCSVSVGAVNSAVSGGTAPYTYLWSNGATSGNIAGLSAGNYALTVTDAHSCTVTANAAVISTPLPVITNNSVTDDYCGNAHGSILNTVSSGTAPYQYLWNTGGNTSESLSNLSAGTYTLTVTDAYGCVASSSYTVQTLPVLALTLSSASDLCSLRVGTITSTVSGGGTPYSYLWSNGATTGDLSGLSSGNYTLTVTDVHGCVITATTAVTATPLPVITANSIENDYCGNSNGSISTTITSGTPPYRYLWSTENNPQGGSITNLSAGIYSLTVTDSHGCAASSTYTIQTPQSLSLTLSAVTDFCSAGVGAVTPTISGGSTPYTYHWSNGATSESLSRLSSGDYALTVTDVHGCAVEDLITVAGTLAPVITIDSTFDDRCSIHKGFIYTSITNGTHPIQYSWNNGATSQDLTFIPEGNYRLTVTDAHGCTATTPFINISDLPAPSVRLLSSTPEHCHQGDGTLNIEVTKSTGEVSIMWNGNLMLNTPYIDHLATGTHQVTVSDDNCTVTKMYDVGFDSGPTAIAHVSNPLVYVGERIHFHSTSKGATSVLWDFDNQSTSTHNTLSMEYLEAGNYEVTLTAIDDHNCKDVAKVAVVIMDHFTFYAPNTFSPNGDMTNDVWKPVITNFDESSYSLYIYDRWGKLLFTTTDYNMGWDGKVSGTLLSGQNVFNYVASVKDLFGKQHVKKGAIYMLQ